MNELATSAVKFYRHSGKSPILGLILIGLAVLSGTLAAISSKFAALYTNQILVIARLMFGLETCGLDLESSTVEILSENPAEYIFNEDPLKT